MATHKSDFSQNRNNEGKMEIEIAAIRRLQPHCAADVYSDKNYQQTNRNAVKNSGCLAPEKNQSVYSKINPPANIYLFVDEYVRYSFKCVPKYTHNFLKSFILE